MERGIIISPRYTYKNGVTEAEGTIRKSDLWFYLTYWDRVVIPQIPSFIPPIGIPAEASRQLQGQFIVASQEVYMPDPSVIPKNPFETLSAALFAHYEQLQPGIWSIGCPSSESQGNADTSQSNVRRIEFDLYNALPTPGPDVPIHEVIDFRNRRIDELVALREAIDELSRELASSADFPRHKTAIIRRLDQALQDVTKTAGESWASLRFLSYWSPIDLGAAYLALASLQQDRVEIAASITLGQGILKLMSKPVSSSSNRFKFVHGIPKSTGDDTEQEALMLITLHDQYELADRSKKTKLTIRFGVSPPQS